MSATTITDQEIEKIHEALSDAWSEYSEWMQIADAAAEDGKEFPFYISGTKRRRDRMHGARGLMHKLRWALDEMSAYQELQHVATRSRGNADV
ncbi:hypothetical protein AQS8620_02584 [Aquimixticola soesokkakensis]|uniref:Uncharacterized protein n=1 Tax=Aquimixticola soesokkakensis TaxID=1519096 RepID=A0A1Y5TDI5_9RHOB|nr:hypothetical protein [Aquimixticola soesokkakensis]SLN57893.1 hypothetical protein AQS8620_02584 [Aquimixticola soesokkakensis]